MAPCHARTSAAAKRRNPPRLMAKGDLPGGKGRPKMSASVVKTGDKGREMQENSKGLQAGHSARMFPCLGILEATCFVNFATFCRFPQHNFVSKTVI